MLLRRAQGLLELPELLELHHLAADRGANWALAVSSRLLTGEGGRGGGGVGGGGPWQWRRSVISAAKTVTLP